MAMRQIQQVMRQISIRAREKTNFYMHKYLPYRFPNFQIPHFATCEMSFVKQFHISSQCTRFIFSSVGSSTSVSYFWSSFISFFFQLKFVCTDCSIQYSIYWSYIIVQYRRAFEITQKHTIRSSDQCEMRKKNYNIIKYIMRFNELTCCPTSAHRLLL